MIRTAFTGLLAAAALPGLAHAAAWTQPKGDGQVILNVFHSESPKGYDADGDKVDIPDFDKTESSIYLEYGVTDRLTAIGQTTYRDISIGSGVDDSGLGYTELGGRYRLGGSDRSVVSAQATARIPGSTDAEGPAQVGSTDPEYDVRALYGHSFKVGEADGFLDLQGGYRFRAGDPPDEWRADLTLGVRPTPKLLLMAQSFNVISNGSGQGVFTDYRYHNVQFSGAYDLTPRLTLNVGVMGTVAGENALRERGGFAGLWVKF